MTKYHAPNPEQQMDCRLTNLSAEVEYSPRERAKGDREAGKQGRAGEG